LDAALSFVSGMDFTAFLLEVVDVVVADVACDADGL
jgi:hypothetical protein